MIGTTLGRYRIVAKLGEGGMGSVWRAEDTLLARNVALKLLATHIALSPDGRERLVREARAASSLEHPGIAAVYDAGETDGQAYIAYQLIEGQTLAARLGRGPLPLPELFRLARGAAAALAHAHARGVLHRDVTAGNVMLREAGEPVIVDFGLARAIGDATLTRTGMRPGTALYLAPEQWRGEPADTRTDLWSLGIVLYQAATGRLPFAGETEEAVMYRVLNEEPVKPTNLRKELPGEFERLVLRLLEKDPRDRLASAADIAAWLPVLELPGGPGTHAPARRESMASRLRRWWHRQARRTFRPTHLAASVVAVLVLFAAGLLLRQRFERGRMRVLAVLPLRNTSKDVNETAYIGEGLGEELVRRLGAAGGFRILPWSTTIRFGDTRDALPQVARRLGADLLLGGDFRSDGERVEVLAELVDGRNGLQVWSDRYSRTASDLIELQTNLALDIARHVNPFLDAAGRARVARSAPSNPEAYEYYVRGANYWHSDNPETQALAEPFFTKAVQLDSTLAVAWVGLGAIRTERVLSREGGAPDLDDADRCFRRALALEPGLPLAERGLIRVITERGPEREAGIIAAAALRRDPEAVESLVTAGWGFVIASLPELATPVLNRALKLDPSSQSASYYRVFALCWDAKFTRSLEAGRDYLRRFGEDIGIYYQMGTAAGALGRQSEASTYFDRIVELNRRTSGPDGDSFDLYVAAWYRSNGPGKRLAAYLDATESSARAIVATHPDNLRAWGDLLILLAEKGDGASFDDAWGRAEPVRASTTPLSYLVPIALAQAGDLRRARRLLAEIGDSTALFWDARMVEHGARFTGGAIPALFASPEYRVLRGRVEAERARRLAMYTPIVDRATGAEAGLRGSR